MGAWIETEEEMYREKLYLVAPHVGAWIETIETILVNKRKGSHPTWVRGLKP